MAGDDRYAGVRKVLADALADEDLMDAIRAEALSYLRKPRPLPDGTCVGLVEMAGTFAQVNELYEQTQYAADREEEYGWWEEPLRVADGDGDYARYRQNALGVLPPRSFWREVPCGHPQSPVAWLMPQAHFACHCGNVLGGPSPEGGITLNEDPIAEMQDDHPDGVIVSCGSCGCYVLVIVP